MEDGDEIVGVRNAFYADDYAGVLKEAKALGGGSSEARGLASVYVARSHLAHGRFDLVFSSVDQRSSMALQAVKLLATYLTAEGDNRELALGTLAEWMADATVLQDAQFRLLAAQIYFEHQDFKHALQLVHDTNTLEAKAMCVQIYLKIDRPDLAAKVLKDMQDTDDDDPLTSFASVWVCVAQGGDKVKEAFDTLQELLEKFGPTIRILNTQAVCHMHQRNFADAFALLKNARDLSKQHGEKVQADTLVNSIVCAQHLGRPQAFLNKIISELKAEHPSHDWLADQTSMGEFFDKNASHYN